jgi:hypothetical protein
MANRETYPAAQSPLQGDISGAAGATTVTVTGFQNIPAQAGTPDDGASWIYDSTVNEWLTEVPPNIAFILNATPNILNQPVGGEFMSDDYAVTVDNVGLETLVSWPYGFGFKVFLNGVGVVGS